MFQLHIEHILLDEQVGTQSVTVYVLGPKSKVLDELEQGRLILSRRIGRLSLKRLRYSLG